MKIKHLLAALLLVSACATQATAHTRTNEIRHRVPGSFFLIRTMTVQTLQRTRAQAERCGTEGAPLSMAAAEYGGDAENGSRTSAMIRSWRPADELSERPLSCTFRVG
jgi:hypothetical protein